ncbi:hypothetical protein ACFLUH_03840 [Chloroflexota bacterium]
MRTRKTKIKAWCLSLLSIVLLILVASPALGAAVPNKPSPNEQDIPVNTIKDNLKESVYSISSPESYYVTINIDERGTDQGNGVHVVPEDQNLQKANFISTYYKLLYPENAVLTLRAYALSSTDGIISEFVSWSGDIGNNDETSETITIILDSDKKVTAHFDDTYRLISTALPYEGGTVFPGVEFYARGNKVTLTAFPKVGYRFDHWSTKNPSAALDEVSPKSNPIVITMEAPTEIWAHFKRIETGPKQETATGSFPWIGFGDGEHGFIPIGPFPEDIIGDWSLPWLPQQESGEDLDVDDEDTEADIGRPDTMTADIKPVVEIIHDQHGCRGMLRVNYEVKHLPEIPYLIDYVGLTIDGVEYNPWTGNPTDHYQDSALKEIGCTGSHNIELEATSTVPIDKGIKDISLTKNVEIPPISCQLTTDFQDIPGEDCRKILKVEFEAHDLSGPEKKLDIISLKVNTSYWYWKEGWNQEHHPKYTVQKEVYPGQVFLLELVATDVDGNKYTYLKEVTVPDCEPPDEPPPPQEPPQDAPPAEETLYVAYIISGQCSMSGEGCGCTVSYSLDAEDRSIGDKYPVTNVKLEVNDGSGWQTWHNSGAISQPAYHYTNNKTGVACGKTFNVRIIATNSIGQTVTTTGTFTTASP